MKLCFQGKFTILDSLVNAFRWPSATMSCRLKQCEKHGPEHSKSRGGCCRASREAALRRSVWDAVYKDRRPPESSMRPARARRGRARVFTSREAWLLGRRMEPVRAAFGQKRSLTPTRGSNPGKLTLVLFLVPFERPPGGQVLSVRGYGARPRTGRHVSGLRSGCGGAARG